ncbi:MAG: fused MFS/spermidine synthase [Thermodesulfovibrionales bacterium]
MGGQTIRGKIIRRARDEHGEIFVVDNHGTRSLYFGPAVVQSSIRLEQPECLIDEYCQAMLGSLIFKPDPDSVLMIGLGGCSLVNFLLTSFPECRLDVVELRQAVIDLAHEFFLVPDMSRNLTIVHAAGEEFIRREQAACYDLIILDAFDERGPAGPLYEKTLLDACSRRLTRDGICSMNLWDGPDDGFPERYAAISDVFGATLRLHPAGRCRNAVVFGSADPGRFGNLTGYRRTAKELLRRYGVNFPRYLSYMSWGNCGQQ